MAFFSFSHEGVWALDAGHIYDRNQITKRFFYQCSPELLNVIAIEVKIKLFKCSSMQVSPGKMAYLFYVRQTKNE